MTMNYIGSCLCGKVKFEVTGSLPSPDACHCSNCRKFSGHFFVSTDIPRSALNIQGEENITWYHSSGKARRGFCSICGSSLFWDPILKDWIGIAMGAFDKPTHTKLSRHIWTSDKGDYYDITDNILQNPQWFIIVWSCHRDLQVACSLLCYIPIGKHDKPECETC